MKRNRLTLISLMMGYAFLYLPLFLMIALSFNKSSIPSFWGGFSLKWYYALWNNSELLSAVMASLKIAALAATLAVFLGTIAAVILVRFGHFFGRTLFEGMTAAPLVMPDVLMGLALLMFFVTLEQAIEWPSQRGLLTVTLAHTTVSLAYVCLIVQARLHEFDRRLEEAALDLGARPVTVFFTITLPIIFPSLLAGWLLAFTLSMDDVVIASFLSGPGATTLPMLIFSSVRFGVTPDINALATVLILIVSLGVSVAGFILYRKVRNQ